MIGSAVVTVLDIPELLERIVAHLTRWEAVAVRLCFLRKDKRE